MEKIIAMENTVNENEMVWIDGMLMTRKEAKEYRENKWSYYLRECGAWEYSGSCFFILEKILLI